MWGEIPHPKQPTKNWINYLSMMLSLRMFRQCHCLEPAVKQPKEFVVSFCMKVVIRIEALSQGEKGQIAVPRSQLAHMLPLLLGFPRPHTQLAVSAVR